MQVRKDSDSLTWWIIEKGEKKREEKEKKEIDTGSYWVYKT